MLRDNIFRVQFLETEAFPAALLCPVPEKAEQIAMKKFKKGLD